MTLIKGGLNVRLRHFPEVPRKAGGAGD